MQSNLELAEKAIGDTPAKGGLYVRVVTLDDINKMFFPILREPSPRSYCPYKQKNSGNKIPKEKMPTKNQIKKLERDRLQMKFDFGNENIKVSD